MFKFIDDSSEYKGNEQTFPTVTFEMPAESSLDDMLYAVEQFLRASGYVFTGSVIIKDEEELND